MPAGTGALPILNLHETHGCVCLALYFMVEAQRYVLLGSILGTMFLAWRPVARVNRLSTGLEKRLLSILDGGGCELPMLREKTVLCT